MAGKNPLTKIVAAATAVLLLIMIYYFSDARHSPHFPACIFFSLSGFYCPGCGSQRAFSSLLHGELWQAANYNLLFIICLPLLLYSVVITLINFFRKEQLVQQVFYSAFFIKILFAVIVIFWITRNLTFHPFNLLAPHAIT